MWGEGCGGGGILKINVTYDLPEDRDAFDASHHAGAAWSAIAEAYNVIRNHIKHGDHAADSVVLVQVKDILSEAQWKRDF